MNNPFEPIYKRLANIECLILDIKHQPSAVNEAQKEKLLTVKEAAAFLKLKIPTIYSKVAKRELPVLKRGKRLYFSDSELSEYLKGGRRKTQEEINDLSNRFVSESSKTNKR